MDIQYYIMPPATSPNLMFPIEYKVLVFDGNNWIEPTRDEEYGRIECVAIPFKDESFARAFSTIEEECGCILISTMERSESICFSWCSWCSEKERLRPKYTPKTSIHNKKHKISQYLVKAAYENNKDILALAAIMFM